MEKTPRHDLGTIAGDAERQHHRERRDRPADRMAAADDPSEDEPLRVCPDKLLCAHCTLTDRKVESQVAALAVVKREHFTSLFGERERQVVELLSQRSLRVRFYVTEFQNIDDVIEIPRMTPGSPGSSTRYRSASSLPSR